MRLNPLDSSVVRRRIVRVTSITLEVFFDGACPLCSREIAALRRLDRAGRMRLTDFAAPDFDPREYGKSHHELLETIHARTADGKWITGVEVFRRIYATIGLGWLVAMTRLPLIAPLLDWGYRRFAVWRLRNRARCASGCRVPISSSRKEVPA